MLGGKKASLGEVYQKLTDKGINILNGFSVTAKGYWEYLKSNNIFNKLQTTLEKLDTTSFANLPEIGDRLSGILRPT